MSILSSSRKLCEPGLWCIILANESTSSTVHCCFAGCVPWAVPDSPTEAFRAVEFRSPGRDFTSRASTRNARPDDGSADRMPDFAGGGNAPTYCGPRHTGVGLFRVLER